jgi:hypothetical protein
MSEGPNCPNLEFLPNDGKHNLTKAEFAHALGFFLLLKKARDMTLPPKNAQLEVSNSKLIGVNDESS